MSHQLTTGALAKIYQDEVHNDLVLQVIEEPKIIEIDGLLGG